MSPRNRLGDIKTMNTLFTAAERFALAAGAKTPGAEHLVLAALELPDGSALRALEAAGGTRQALRNALGVGPGEQPEANDRGPFRSQKSLQRIFKPVVKRVRKERSQLFGAYVLLSALEEQDPATMAALRVIEADAEALVAAATEELRLLNR